MPVLVVCLLGFWVGFWCWVFLVFSCSAFFGLWKTPNFKAKLTAIDFFCFLNYNALDNQFCSLITSQHEKEKSSFEQYTYKKILTSVDWLSKVEIKIIKIKQ